MLAHILTDILSGIIILIVGGLWVLTIALLFFLLGLGKYL